MVWSLFGTLIARVHFRFEIERAGGRKKEDEWRMSDSSVNTFGVFFS